MGLWKEAKEWKESMLDLDARLAVSGSLVRFAVVKISVSGSDGSNGSNVRCGGAVTDRRPESPCGRVGVLRESIAGAFILSAGTDGVGESVHSSCVSSSVLSSLGTVEGLLEEFPRSL